MVQELPLKVTYWSKSACRWWRAHDRRADSLVSIFFKWQVLVLNFQICILIFCSFWGFFCQQSLCWGISDQVRKTSRSSPRLITADCRGNHCQGAHCPVPTPTAGRGPWLGKHPLPADSLQRFVLPLLLIFSKFRSVHWLYHFQMTGSRS